MIAVLAKWLYRAVRGFGQILDAEQLPARAGLNRDGFTISQTC